MALSIFLLGLVFAASAAASCLVIEAVLGLLSGGVLIESRTQIQDGFQPREIWVRTRDHGMWFPSPSLAKAWVWTRKIQQRKNGVVVIDNI